MSAMTLLDAWLLPFLLAYAWFLTRILSTLGETFDGFIGITNALFLGGAPLPYNYLKLAKAPLGSLALAPFASYAYSRFGPEAALRASHVFQIAATAALVGLSWAFFRRLYDRGLAAVLTVLLAFNPVLLRNAAFSNFDVFGVLFALLFVMSVLAYHESPTTARYLRLLAFGAAAFLVKYHQGMLLGVPPLLVFLKGLKVRVRALLLAVPLLGAALSLAVLGLFSLLWMRGSHVSLRTALDLAFRANITGRTVSLVYFREMYYQLGPLLSLFTAAGFVLWCVRPDPKAKVLAASLGLPILILSTVIKTSESRYTLFILPFVCAAAGATIDAFGKRLPKRWPLLLVALAAFPWLSSYGALERLVEDPNFNTRLPYIVARYAERGEGAGDCLAFMTGEIRYPVPPSPSPMMDNWTSTLRVDNLQFFTRLPIALVDDQASGHQCRPRALLVPRYHSSDPPEGGRWQGGELGRLYEWPRRPKPRFLRLGEYGIL